MSIVGQFHRAFYLHQFIYKGLVQCRKSIAVLINKNITAADALGRIGALAKAARLECGCAHGGGEHKAALHGRKQRKRRGAIGNEYMLRCVEINIVLAGNAQRLS